MDLLTIGAILVVSMMLMLASGVWIGITLTGVGIIALFLVENESVGLLLGTSSWSATTGWSLTALPLFIWIGEFLFRTNLSKDLFQGLAPLLTRIPGRLLHVNILASGLFAAVSGSSAATVAAVGKMSLPELEKRGYPSSMSIGTLAGAGTLGLLIPPSIILIIYGVTAEVSIARLFLAGIFPGLLLIALFMGYTIIWAIINDKEKARVSFSLKEKITALKKLVPILLLIFAILGSIYNGIATPTEAAAFGVFGAILLSILSKSFSLQNFFESIKGTVKSSCMLGFILLGAHFLTLSMAFVGIPNALAEWISTLGLSEVETIIYLALFFIVLGLFIDGISIIVLSSSIILPMVSVLGIDLIWFGIFLVLVVEMAQITPPVGFNLFVLQSLTGKDIFSIARSAIPFFIIIAIAIVIIYIYPSIVLYLPTLMTTK